jgi:hypothetical protein
MTPSTNMQRKKYNCIDKKLLKKLTQHQTDTDDTPDFHPPPPQAIKKNI